MKPVGPKMKGAKSFYWNNLMKTCPFWLKFCWETLLPNVNQQWFFGRKQIIILKVISETSFYPRDIEPQSPLLYRVIFWIQECCFWRISQQPLLRFQWDFFHWMTQLDLHQWACDSAGSNENWRFGEPIKFGFEKPIILGLGRGFNTNPRNYCWTLCKTVFYTTCVSFRILKPALPI